MSKCFFLAPTGTVINLSCTKTLLCAKHSVYVSFLWSSQQLCEDSVIIFIQQREWSLAGLQARGRAVREWQSGNPDLMLLDIYKSPRVWELLKCPAKWLFRKAQNTTLWPWKVPNVIPSVSGDLGLEKMKGSLRCDFWNCHVHSQHYVSNPGQASHKNIRSRQNLSSLGRLHHLSQGWASRALSVCTTQLSLNHTLPHPACCFMCLTLALPTQIQVH